MLKGSEWREGRGGGGAQKCAWGLGRGGGVEGVTVETKSEQGRSVNENLRPKSGNKMTTGTNRRSGREEKKDKERNEL